jgi:Holliday junction resolvase-like predicted endonuclease
MIGPHGRHKWARQARQSVPAQNRKLIIKTAQGVCASQANMKRKRCKVVTEEVEGTSEHCEWYLTTNLNPPIKRHNF